MKMFDAGKTRMIGYRIVKKNYDDTLSRFYLIPERHGRTDRRTDRQTDGQNCYINIVRQYADARYKLLNALLAVNRTSLKTLMSLARLRRVKYGRFWLLSGCRVLSLSDRRYSLNPLSQTRID